MKRIEDIQELEFELFKELDINLGIVLSNENILDKFTSYDLLHDNSTIVIVIKVLDEENKMLVKDSRGRIFIIQNDLNFKDNDILRVFGSTYYDNKDDKIMKIKIEDFTEEKINELNNLIDKKNNSRKIYRKIRGKIENGNEKELNFNIINNLIPIAIKEIDKEEKEEEEEEKQNAEKERKRELEEEKKNGNIKTYNEKSCYTEKDKFSIIGNVFKTTRYWNKASFIMEENFNKILTFKEMKDLFAETNRYYSGEMSYEEKFIEKQIPFIKKAENGTEKYNITFKDGMLSVKNVKIPKGKVKFVLSRINKDTAEDEIKKLKKLSGMKIDVLKCVEINFNELHIPFKIEYIDDNNFKMSFIGKEINVDWKFLRNLFFNGGGTRYFDCRLSQREILNLSLKMNSTKTELFTILKRLNMLKELKGDNED